MTMEKSFLVSIYGKEAYKPLSSIIFALLAAFSAEVFLRSFQIANLGMSRAARISIVFLVIYTIHRFALTGLRQYRPKIKDLITLFVLLVISLFSTAVGRVLAQSLSAYFGQITPESLYFAIPFAAAGILIQALMGLQYSFIFSLSLSFILAVYFPQEIILAPLALSTSLVACLSMTKFRTRSAYLKAGFSVVLISIPFVLSSLLLVPDPTFLDLVVRLAAAIIGGITCAFVVAGTAPILEYLGDYVTDISLLEIATLDHPLLKELSIQAPGTWNHSMVIGMMVEAAADETKANPIVARVGAYYHDIGKMKKPLYFVENQARGENRHEKLSPSMSALIIKSHVKEGLELAGKHRIPQIIQDLIPQHHGTSLIEYFYDKACKEAQETATDGQAPAEVDETLYRYPGPRPQTKEAGILMLADGIEAATRSISEPTPDRIQGLVQKMLNKTFASGELDECELTLKDLHKIAKAFTRVLSGIYHQRIAYAEPAEKTSERNREDAQENTQVVSLNLSPDQKQKGETENTRPKESSKEDLKRLGM